ncbi:MAG: hypothetical protein A3K10_14765 [Bacteroidetes bacterium RIFCSPLOWO2_12_FULL_31_6]|nr:MAG: hypothetical protein A3K10_14765 [Bacteroidetes bacterium RIFCSPLOWO2_12_FULL_31_6]
MKNQLLSIAFILFTITSFAQPWTKGGNNPSPFPFVMGSNTNNAIMFETFDITRMYINGVL